MKKRRKRTKSIVVLLLSSIILVVVLVFYQTEKTKKITDNKSISFEELVGQDTTTQMDEMTMPTETPEDIQRETPAEFDETAASESESPQEASYDEASYDGASYNEAFYYTELTEEIRERITGKSYPDISQAEEPLQITYEDLAYVHVLHYDFQAQIQEGELICNRAIAQDLIEIFRELYENQYPIEKIRLIDVYNADDEASMADNNTSCFNYRTVSGSTKLSNHSYGCAIDINPLYNPYVRTRDGKELISPENAAPYADRSADFPYKIDREDLCYKLFTAHGFEWGGAWNSSKDYQHFQKNS